MLKTITLADVGQVTIARRKGTKHIRLSVNGGIIRLGVPYGISEQAALKFLHKKRDWIQSHKQIIQGLRDGDRIGRAHRLKFEPRLGAATTTRVASQEVTVRHPLHNNPSDASVQTAAIRASKKALLLEAESLLPQRLRYISKQIDINYKNASVKFLKSRWGSCSNKAEITLNAYLIQLEWDLIDYVIIHELVHVKHHNHGPAFWLELEKHLPKFQNFRKTLKTKQTELKPNTF